MIYGASAITFVAFIAGGVNNYRENSFMLKPVRQQATVEKVRIKNIVHKGLKRLFQEDSAKGLPPDAVEKLRAMFGFLQDMQDPEACGRFRSGKPTNLRATERTSGACT